MNKFYPIVVVQIADADGGGFMGHVPDLKGCMSHGDTPEEALANAREAALEWIEEAKAQGFVIPEPGTTAANARKERDALLATIKVQSEAIDKMGSDIQKFETDIAALSATLDAVTDRLSAESPYATLIAHQKLGDYEDVIH
jgi:antitoxin HicB